MYVLINLSEDKYVDEEGKVTLVVTNRSMPKYILYTMYFNSVVNIQNRNVFFGNIIILHHFYD